MYTEDQDSAQGDERRIILVRAELLPPVSAGSAHGPAGRYLDVSPGVPLYRASEELVEIFILAQ